MIRDSNKFISLKPIQRAEVVVSANIRCKIISIGKVGVKFFSHINNVRMVKRFKHNL